MNIQKPSFRTVLVAVILALCVPVTAEAQFLKKLSKGLEKVNNTLDKVEKSVNNQPGQRQQPPVQTSGTQQTVSNANSEAGMEAVKPSCRHPYLTSRTRYLDVPGYSYGVSDVYDDIFAVKRGSAWEFWRVDGTKLFDADWEYCGWGTYGGDAPRFSGGAAVARAKIANVHGKKPVCILYADGRVKQLDPSYEKVSHFVDGIAIVEQKVNYKSKYFFINPAGAKVYPALNVIGDSKDAIRPLRDNRRAYKCEYKEWAFIDAQGKPAFTGKYLEARDFSDGYAWVRIPTGEMFVASWALIDTDGNIVFQPGAEYDRTKISTDKITDVADGRFCMVRGNEAVYYDISGKELLRVEAGTPFYGGYAFVTSYSGYKHLDNGCMLVNTALEPVKLVSSEVCPAYKVDDNSLQFQPYGLASLASHGYVLDPEGNVVLSDYDNHKGDYIRGFKQFGLSGYARCSDVWLNDKQYIAFMKPSGEIAWMFSDGGGGGQFDEPVGPPDEPIETIRQPGPPFPIPPIELTIVDINQKAVGPTDVAPAKFNVSVVATPAEGGTVSISPSGTFTYGEYAAVNASANEDWAISSISSSVGGKVKSGVQFPITTDQTITVKFVKKDDDKKPEHSGAYQGSIRVEQYSVPVYMQVSSDGTEATPYGDSTYGFVQIMFDPTIRYTNEKGEFAVSLFAVPLQITGVQKDEATGWQWLVLDGGSVAFHDLKVNPGDPLMTLWISTLMSLNGYDEVNSKPRHYRVEMLDVNPETGEFTFGNLQAYSAENGGWFAGGDNAVSETKRGFMASMTDRGYPSDAFFGAKMKQTSPRNDIRWYPPQEWSKNQSAFELLMNSMKCSYCNAKSDYNKLFGE